MKKPLSEEARLREAALWRKKKEVARDLPNTCHK